mgnify:CR=1
VQESGLNKIDEFIGPGYGEYNGAINKDINGADVNGQFLDNDMYGISIDIVGDEDRRVMAIGAPAIGGQNPSHHRDNQTGKVFVYE